MNPQRILENRIKGTFLKFCRGGAVSFLSGFQLNNSSVCSHKLKRLNVVFANLILSMFSPYTLTFCKKMLLCCFKEIISIRTLSICNKLKFWNPYMFATWWWYDIGFKTYGEKEIRVCGKGSIPFKKNYCAV